ncbi:MAG: helix-turn-helix domain-containing protein [Rhodospirillales bacterium]|nr:helix-turn-helix domain-containing protein [Rhodospirillales bacterium]
MSARRFGTEAMGDPCFDVSLARGRALRLHTADRALSFMGRPPLGPLLRAEVEAFLAVSGTKASVLGGEALGNPSFVGRLRRGASPQLSTFDRVRAWMAANASEDELRAVRERLADVPDPFEETRDAAQTPAIGVNTEEDSRADGNLLHTREAAARLGLSPKTLERYRASGEGPAFRKPGARVRYRPSDLDAWAAARRWTSLSRERGARSRKER